MAALPVIVIAAGLWVWLTTGRYEETDNASFQQARIAIASEVSGRVSQTYVTDSQRVTAGTPLFRVDPQPYELALAQTDAALAQARLGVDQLRAGYRQSLAQEKVAQDSLNYYQTELTRQQALSGRGVGTESALDEARHNANSARESESAAQQAVQAALAGLGGNPEITTDEHPSVRAAIVARDKAAYDLTLTTVTAPADGIIYKADSFKSGQFVSAGATLFTLVETGDSWITANFKETQIARMHPGQTAKISFDGFPGQELDAVIESIGAGTGAEFSVLPAQNATGNWVKVTQRLPVKLRLTADADTSALRTGLSAAVTVDTRAETHFDQLVSRAEGGAVTK
ncbi:MAG TPA: HlyD family secretion protein [Paenirhodobacter sp.]